MTQKACNDCPFRQSSSVTYCADALEALEDAHEPSCHKLVAHDAIFDDPMPGKKACVGFWQWMHLEPGFIKPRLTTTEDNQFFGTPKADITASKGAA